MIIRESSKSDFAMMAVILRKIYESSASDSYNWDQSDEDIVSSIKDCQVFLLDGENEVVGLAAVQIMNNVEGGGQEENRFTKIATFVALGVVGNGIGHGATLFRHVKSHLKDQGVVLLTAFVASHNTRALKLYERLGFTSRTIQIDMPL